MKKLAIVCGAPSTQMKAPFNDRNYDIWALAFRFDIYPKYDLLFDVHDGEEHLRDKGIYLEALEKLDCPVVVGRNTALKLKNPVIYPFEEVEKLFGSLYLTSSCSYMLAMAILQGYKHIEVYGVDLGVSDDEYFYQRPCFEAWLGFAKGRGINVIIPEESSCLKSSHLYGCDLLPLNNMGIFSEGNFSEMIDYHAHCINEVNNEVKRLALLKSRHEGSLEALAQLQKVSRAVASGQKLNSLKSSIIE